MTEDWLLFFPPNPHPHPPPPTPSPHPGCRRWLGVEPCASFGRRQGGAGGHRRPARSRLGTGDKGFKTMLRNLKFQTGLNSQTGSLTADLKRKLRWSKIRVETLVEVFFYKLICWALLGTCYLYRVVPSMSLFTELTCLIYVFFCFGLSRAILLRRIQIITIASYAFIQAFAYKTFTSVWKGGNLVIQKSILRTGDLNLFVNKQSTFHTIKKNKPISVFA